MMNFSLSEFIAIRMQLSDEQRDGAQHRNGAMSEEVADRLAGLIARTALLAQKMSLDNTGNRVTRAQAALVERQSYGQVLRELAVLFEAMEDDAKKHDFYHYPTGKAGLVRSIKHDWRSTRRSFKSIKPEIIEAVDCYALDHPTASVFHLMRIAEHGLRALARERSVFRRGIRTPFSG